MQKMPLYGSSAHKKDILEQSYYLMQSCFVEMYGIFA